MNEKDWPFADPPNLAVFTEKRIIDRETWIHYVTHDADDGAWQFHGPDELASEKDARLVGLKTMVKLDGTLALLADLPLGWCAWRATPNSGWQRAPKK